MQLPVCGAEAVSAGDYKITLRPGDCMDVLATIAENSVDACCTDPPYHLTSMVKRFANAKIENENYAQTSNSAYMSRGFMGKQWDGGDIAFRVETWREVYRVLKPGAHLLAFGGTRTFHRMACAIEDAGFEIRDTIQWLYGSGFPKSHDVSKGIDRADGFWRGRAGDPVRAGESFGQEYERNGKGEPITDAARQWEGWGTALKPACEPIVLARKPLSERTVAANVLRWGTGALNIDGCRVEHVTVDGGSLATNPHLRESINGSNGGQIFPTETDRRVVTPNQSGRWPANVIHDGSDEVVAAFPESDHARGNTSPTKRQSSDGVWSDNGSKYGIGPDGKTFGGDEGSAARFFYQVKQDDQCHSINSANDAGENFGLQSEHVVSVLTHVVAASTPRLALQKQSYRAQNTNVLAQELEIICASVTEIIQNLERRYALGFPHENLEARLPGVRCAAIPKQIGTTTITIDRSTLGPYVELATFDIIEMSAEVGELVCASRLFYTSKADSDDRIGSKHPTVKPLDLMQYLVRLICPPKGLLLDPFAGSGTTGEAAFREGMRAVLIECEAEYLKDIERRIELLMSGPDERAFKSQKAKQDGKPIDAGPLFGGKMDEELGPQSIYGGNSLNKSQTMQTTRRRIESNWDDMWTRPFDRTDLL
jgi:site-specific DNA-methyltransferase (adenine-specific)